MAGGEEDPVLNMEREGLEKIEMPKGGAKAVYSPWRNINISIDVRLRARKYVDEGECDCFTK